MSHTSDFPDDPQAQQEQQNYSSPVPSRDYILQTLQQAAKPLSQQQLSKRLQLQPQHQRGFAFRLRAMVRDGQIVCNRRKKFGIVANMDQFQGRVIGHADGFGYLESLKSKERYFVSHREMRKVFHGDVVLAYTIGQSNRKMTEVAISQVLQHHTQQVVGRLFREGNVAFVQSTNKQIANDVVVINPPKISADSLVHVKITHQPTSKSLAIGEIQEILRPNKRRSLEVDIAIRSYQIPYEFTQAQLNVANRFSPVMNRQACAKVLKAGRTDLRHLPLVTVDGEDAQDFDDALFCEQQNGNWRLIVAIADVSNYVPAGSSLDREAQKRGNSVYFPNRVIPMLPFSLSHGICSLNPDVERLCLCCEMHILSSGELLDFHFFEGLMCSAKRFTYKQLERLQRSSKSHHWQQVDVRLRQPIADLLGLYNSLKKNRRRRGSIEIDTPVAEFKFAKSGRIRKIKATKRLRTHKIIEECMLMANVAASQFLQQHEAVFLYRVHGSPKTENITSLNELLTDLGIAPLLQNPPSTAEIAQLLRNNKKHPMASTITVSTLRSLKQAIYSSENIGHFGLNFSAYTHFTSPIRRYSDLLVHRQIKAILRQQQPLAVNQQELEKIGEHLSFTERRADEATRDVITALKCQFAQKHLGCEFVGRIVSITSFGAFVHLQQLQIEGLLHIANLGDDYFHFDSICHRLLGESTAKIYQIGDELVVQLAKVDIAERRIDLVLIKQQQRQASKAKLGNVPR